MELLAALELTRQDILDAKKDESEAQRIFTIIEQTLERLQEHLKED